jgi:Glyoxalase/Bleomycin resistance protein/Dioxygenase superfamily
MSGAFGQIMQHGYVVKDVKKAALEWSERVGVGPFYVLDRIAMDEYYYRGKRTDVEVCLGFGYWGSVQVELIQPLGDTDTLYSRALQSSAGALNHCATVVSDIDKLLKSRNLENRIIQSGSMATGVKFVYLDSYLPGGQHLELIQATPETQAAFAGMEALGRQWDGRNPVRSASDMAEDLAKLSAKA